MTDNPNWGDVRATMEFSALETIAQHRLVPVIVCGNAARADELGTSLVAGGLPIAEVTLRTAVALDAMAELSKNEQLLVGAGTVLSADSAREAIDRGAKFIVSPGLDEEIVRVCQDAEIDVLPGVVTATEIQQAHRLGLRAVKFFPAEAIGGAALLKALAAPFGDMRFVPTGGIGPDNLGEYITKSAVLACGGSWMVRRDWIAAGNFAAIREAVEQAVGLAAFIKQQEEL